MSALFAVLGVLALCGGAVAERLRLLPAPGFAATAGALVAVYLWFFAKTRRFDHAPRGRKG